ncbi:hypothetical protein Tco_0156375, partial [Tanacetum coccineum]
IIGLDTSSEEIDYDSLDYRGPPKSLLKWYGYLSDEYKDKGGNKSGAILSQTFQRLKHITNAILGLANAETWDAIVSMTFRVKIPPTMACAEEEDYTDKENMDKDTTDEDCIHECNYAMSKGKYVLVSHKHYPKVKSLEAVKGCVLGLANVTIWEEIMNKMGVRKSKMCTEKAKGKRKLS